VTLHVGANPGLTRRFRPCLWPVFVNGWHQPAMGTIPDNSVRALAVLENASLPRQAPPSRFDAALAVMGERRPPPSSQTDPTGARPTRPRRRLYASAHSSNRPLPLPPTHPILPSSFLTPTTSGLPTCVSSAGPPIAIASGNAYFTPRTRSRLAPNP
jgi:hypothetical protein